MSAQDMAQLAEELQPLAAEAPQVPRTGRRTKAVVAVGLGLALAAAYTMTPGSTEPHPATANVDGVEGKFKALIAAMGDKKWGTGPLSLESDMGKFIQPESLPTGFKPPGLLGASASKSAETLFDSVVKASTIGKELNAKELKAYKLRFVSSMVKMLDTNRGVKEDYFARAKRHIEGTKPVMSESLAAVTNNRQKSFKTKMQDWMLEESSESFNSRLIKVDWKPPADSTKVFKSQLPNELGLKGASLPRQFSSGDFWPKCKSVVENPHNQGRCGSCWVFGATGALDSRLCIATDGAFSGPKAELSRGVGASCAADWDGCQGGWPHLIYDYIAASGGLPTTKCVPYFGGTDYASHWTDAMGAPPCPATCDSRFPRQMAEDRFNPAGIAQYKLVDQPSAQGIADLKEAIMNEGPVAYAFYANNAFMGYTSGVFDQACGHQANHAVQAIGFGKDLSGKDFIQSLNSWGTLWGNKGQFNVAYCVVWHYVIPGSIQASADGSGYPLPIPDWKQ